MGVADLSERLTFFRKLKKLRERSAKIGGEMDQEIGSFSLHLFGCPATKNLLLKTFALCCYVAVIDILLIESVLYKNTR